MDFYIGESTLETLPGTITPPTAVYSPPPKLTDECIPQSCTSTPLHILKSAQIFQTTVPLFTQEVQLKLQALARRRLKKVKFDVIDKPGKIRKKKNRYDPHKAYLLFKNGGFSVVDKARAIQLGVCKRVNDGDLIR